MLALTGKGVSTCRTAAGRNAGRIDWIPGRAALFSTVVMDAVHPQKLLELSILVFNGLLSLVRLGTEFLELQALFFQRFDIGFLSLAVGSEQNILRSKTLSRVGAFLYL